MYKRKDGAGMLTPEQLEEAVEMYMAAHQEDFPVIDEGENPEEKSPVEQIRENTDRRDADIEAVTAEEIPQIAKDSRRAVKGLAKRFFHLPGDTINMIEPGHAAVVETPEGRAGVYKSEDNQIYQVDVVCPHLGCRLAWNQDERSWDCPCHGSRFDYKGNLLDGPAQEGICLGGEVREGDK